MTSGQQKASNMIGPLRRVVRLGNYFLCGICRGSYPDGAAAHSCLRRCWEEFLAADLVLSMRRGRQVFYRCRLCARDYLGLQDATACARDCKERFKMRFEMELKLASNGDLPPAPQRKSRARNVPSMPVLRPLPRLPKKEPVEVTEAPPVTADIRTTISESEPADSEHESLADAREGGEPEPVKAKKKRPAQVFYRDNAKYACSICNARYFTKQEVDACFEGHEDYE